MASVIFPMIKFCPIKYVLHKYYRKGSDTISTTATASNEFRQYVLGLISRFIDYKPRRANNNKKSTLFHNNDTKIDFL